MSSSEDERYDRLRNERPRSSSKRRPQSALVVGATPSRREVSLVPPDTEQIASAGSVRLQPNQTSRRRSRWDIAEQSGMLVPPMPFGSPPRWRSAPPVIQRLSRWDVRSRSPLSMGRGIRTIQVPPSATVSTPPVGSSASSVAHAVVSLTPGASSLSSVASVSSSGTPESCVIQEASCSAEVVAGSDPDPEGSSSAGNLSQSTTSLIRRPKSNKVCPLGCPGTNTQVKRHLGHNHLTF